MAAKILLAAFAVMCAFGALNAKPHAQTLSITPNYVVEKLQQALAVVHSAIQEVDAKVDAGVTAMMDKIDADANELAERWNAQVDNLAQKATSMGVDVAECIVMQKQLPPVVDNLRAQARECAETQMKGLRAAVQELEGLNPAANAILDDAKLQVAQCDQDGGHLSNILCLGKVLMQEQGEATKLIGQVVVKSGKIVAQVAAAVPNVALCSSKTTSASVAAANEIGQATVSCFQNKFTKH